MGDPPSAPRRGLGFFPPAVVIRSGPPRSLRGYTDTNESAGPSRSDSQTAAVDSGYTGPPLPSRSGREAYEVWKDWNINPGGHGGRRGPPVFVPPSGSYDELGRSVGDGFGVAVDNGEGGEAKDDDKKMAGGEVADWYRSLSLRPSANVSAQASGSSTPVAHPKQASPGRESGDAPVTAGSTSVPPPSPPSPPEPSVQNLPRPKPASSSPSSSSASTPTLTLSSTSAPVRVNRSEWFIRRALLSRAGQESERPSPAPPQPSSIGAMLNLDTARPAPAPRRYAIGPDNAGYARLEALGWGGGGLGRPEGWERDVREAPRKRRRDTEVEVVDLTADSDSDSGSDADTQPRVTAKAPDRGTVSATSSSGGRSAREPTAVSAPPSPDSDDERDGPGRTMPVATALKLDRLGLGRAAHVKKVTHSAAEIAAAQRRAKGKRDKRGGEMGKREKIKWADRDKRDRDARRRIQQALNA